MSAGVLDASRVSLVPKALTEHRDTPEDRAKHKRAMNKARQATARQLRETLEYVGLEQQAERMGDCGKVWISSCGECGGMAARPVYTCNFKLCPWCLHRRGIQRADELTPYVMAFENAIHLTITVKNGEDLVERDAHLREGWKKLVRRQLWKEAIKTAFVFWEVTYDVLTGTYHPHLHVIADGWIGQGELAEEWQEITEDSRIVYVQQLKGGVEGVREACKYPLKGDEFANSPRAVLDYLEATQGKRQMWTYGYPRGNWRDSKRVEVEVPHEDAVERAAAEANVEKVDVCPHCGAIEAMGAYLVGEKRRWWDRGDVKAVEGGWYVLDE